MKRPFEICFVIALLFFSPTYLRAQASAPTLAGFVFANAIGIKEKADITANGQKLTSAGVVPGIASSGLGLPPGSYNIVVTAPECESAKASIQLTVGATPILVAYLDPAPDPTTHVPKNFIRLLQLPAQPQTEKYLINAVAVDRATAFTASVGGQTQALEFLKPVLFEGKRITVNDQTGHSDSTAGDERCSYCCFVFRKADGTPGTILVPQRIYRW